MSRNGKVGRGTGSVDLPGGGGSGVRGVGVVGVSRGGGVVVASGCRRLAAGPSMARVWCGGGGVVVGTSGCRGPSVRAGVWSGVLCAGVVIVPWRLGSPHADVRPHFPVVLTAAGVKFVVGVVWRVGSPHADLLPHFPPVVAPGRRSVWQRRVSSNGAPGSLMARFCVPKAFHLSAGFWNVTILVPVGGSKLARIAGGSSMGASAGESSCLCRFWPAVLRSGLFVRGGGARRGQLTG